MTDKPRRPRPWTIEELHAGNVLRLTPAKKPHGARVIRQVPTLEEQDHAAGWKIVDKWSKEVMREIQRLGYTEVREGADERHAYFLGVGRSGMTLSIRVAHSRAGGVVVTRVGFGRESWTARQAALWLRKRAAS